MVGFYSRVGCGEDGQVSGKMHLQRCGGYGRSRSRSRGIEFVGCRMWDVGCGM